MWHRQGARGSDADALEDELAHKESAVKKLKEKFEAARMDLYAEGESALSQCAATDTCTVGEVGCSSVVVDEHPTCWLNFKTIIVTFSVVRDGVDVMP